MKPVVAPRAADVLVAGGTRSRAQIVAEDLPKEGPAAMPFESDHAKRNVVAKSLQLKPIFAPMAVDVQVAVGKWM